MSYSFLDTLLPQTEFSSYEDFRANFRLNTPPNFNFGTSVVDAIAEKDPDRKAVVWCDDHGGERIITMGQLSRESNKAAAWFQSMGVKKGDRVLLILRRRWEYWVGIIGLHKIGATAIPATIMLKPHDIVYRIEAAHVKLVLALDEPALRNSLAEARAQLGDRMPPVALCGISTQLSEGMVDFNKGLDAAPEKYARPEGENAIDPEKDAMLLFFTSGTSGMPKMVQHNFLYPLGHVITAKYWHCVVPGGLHYTVAETGWAKCSWGKIYGQMISDCAVMVYDMDRFHAENVVNVVKKYGVTTFCAPPSIYRFFIKEALHSDDWKNVVHCTTAGEALNPEVFNQFKKATGLEIFEGFGQTETTVLLGTFKWMTPKPGSMGKPSPWYPIEVVDENGVPCENNEEGQIAIKVTGHQPAGLTTGYRDANDKLNKDSWYDGYYHTGDLAWRDEDGYFWFVGRADDVIKSSGYRIGPFEVESAVMEHPSVLECAITGVPDPLRGTVVKATIVLARGYEPSEELVKEIQDHVKRTTAPYKYPRVVEFVKELPKTYSGKIKHAAIRAAEKTKE